MSIEPKKYTDEQIREARAKLWYMGNLEWKFDPTQKKMYDFWKGISKKTSVINCSRRLGKSYFLTVIAVQQCIQKPKSIVKFLQPEQKMIRMNIRPLMDSILEDCPPDLRPEFKTQDNIYKFPNGSELQLAGTDNGNHEKLRGGDAHLCLVDEAAFVKYDLQYIIRSVLLPTTLLTRGKIILSSTSPKEPTHDFAKYMEHAETQGSLLKKTIYDALEDNKGLANPRFTEEIVEEIINEYPGGALSDDFRRECLCEIITDGDNAIIPEFTAEIEKDVVVEWPRPLFFDKYVSMDIGFKDLTAVLFAYYDFLNGVLVIEDELIMNGIKMTTEKLAEEIVIKEKYLWTDKLTGEFTPPYLRISDNNLIVINDLQRLHNINFIPTSKDNKEAAINQLRIMLDNRQILIHPKCKNLISHLKNGTWNKNKTKFSRSADNGHYDLIDALIYLVRNINRTKNPYPRNYNLRFNTSSDNLFVNPNYSSNTSQHEEFFKLFKPLGKVNKYK